MCIYYPTQKDEIYNINGVGSTKLERYGTQFMNVIKKYLDENPDIEKTKTMPAPSNKSRKRIKGETLERTFELFKKGHGVGKIARIRDLTESTIAGHIEDLIIDGRDIDISSLIDSNKRKEIENLFKATETWNLTPVVGKMDGRITYDEARFVRAYLQRKKAE